MKDHKVVSRKFSIYDLEGEVSNVITFLQSLTKDLIKPRIEVESEYDDIYFKMVGWVPMTPEEIKKAKDQRKKKNENAKNQKLAEQAKELEQLETLAAKYGKKLFDQKENNNEEES